MASLRCIFKKILTGGLIKRPWISKKEKNSILSLSEIVERYPPLSLSEIVERYPPAQLPYGEIFYIHKINRKKRGKTMFKIKTDIKKLTETTADGFFDLKRAIDEMKYEVDVVKRSLEQFRQDLNADFFPALKELRDLLNFEDDKGGNDAGNNR